LLALLLLKGRFLLMRRGCASIDATGWFELGDRLMRRPKKGASPDAWRGA
jgi:hypothetical protein